MSDQRISMTTRRRTIIACISASLALHPIAQAEDTRSELQLSQVEQTPGKNGKRLVVFTHRATPGLDSPGQVAAGLEYHLTLGLPSGCEPDSPAADQRFPIVMVLHGFGDGWQAIRSYGDFHPNAVTIIPNDPLGTWFYGYSDQLPGGDPDRGTVVNYTERRLLSYVAYCQSHFPIDSNRIYVRGGSMGGTGSISLALRYPNIFAAAQADKGATNRRHCRWKSQCETVWGHCDANVHNQEGIGVWDWQNMAWYMQHHHRQATWLRTMHGREDASIFFSQVAGPPGIEPMSFYAAIETFKIGHQCIWDARSHRQRYPQDFQADDEWDPFGDPICYLALDRSFPAFSNFSANDDPGTGAGDPVGNDDDLGNNTYDGDPHGGLNRFLRWNTTTISDEAERYSIELCLSSGEHGYHGNGETVDVTLRRLQKFAVTADAAYDWSTSTGQHGRASADAEGLLTIPKVPVRKEWTSVSIAPAR
jgi:hypothetical protein